MFCELRAASASMTLCPVVITSSTTTRGSLACLLPFFQDRVFSDFSDEELTRHVQLSQSTER